MFRLRWHINLQKTGSVTAYTATAKGMTRITLLAGTGKIYSGAHVGLNLTLKSGYNIGTLSPRENLV